MDRDEAITGKYLHEEFVEKYKGILDIVHPETGKIFTQDQYRRLLPQEDVPIFEQYLATIPDQASDFASFNYTYNDQGQLRHMVNGRKFHWVSQPHYDGLGDVVAEHIQHLLVSKYNFTRLHLPLPSQNNNNNNNNAARDPSTCCPIFLSPSWETKNTLVLLIQGTGAVRPGQWARALCINDTLTNGSIFPYLDQILSRDFGVIVFNPNQNTYLSPPPTPLTKEHMLTKTKGPGSRPLNIAPGTKQIEIEGNEDNEQHTLYVWDNVVAKHWLNNSNNSDSAKEGKNLIVIAHSLGGESTLALIRNRRKEVEGLIRAIAFTDSVHSLRRGDKEELRKIVREKARNWVRSNKKLDESMGKGVDKGSGCEEVSAGHEKHEYTSGYCISSVFAFIDEKMKSSSS